MAITRAQQYRQMLENGGRGISLQEAKDMAPKGEFLAYINKKEAKMLKDAGGSGVMTNAGIPSFIEYDDSSGSGFKSAKSTGSVRGDVDRGKDDSPPMRTRIQNEQQEEFRKKQLKELIDKQQEEKAFEPFESLIIRPSGIPTIGGKILDAFRGPRQKLLNRNLDFYRFDPRTVKARAKYGLDAAGYKKYMSERLAGTIDAAGNPIMTGDEDDGPDPILPIIPKATDGIGDNTEEEIPFQPNFRLLADGGRVGLAKGSRMQSGEAKESRKKSSTPTNPNKRRGAVDEKTTDPRITPGGDKPTRPIINDEGIGSLTSKKDIPTFNNDITRINLKDLIGLGLDDQEEENIQLAEAINFGTLPQAQEKFEPDFGGMLDATQNLGKSYKGTTRGDFIDAIEAGAFGPGTQQMFDRNVGDVFQGVPLDASFFSTEVGDVNPQFISPKGSFGGTIDIRKDQLANPEDLPAGFFVGAEGGRAGFAGGGMPYEGGIMDLESSRQMYGLGKLVKKVTRSVKKIADSPIGKIALGAALFGGVGSGGVGSFFGKGSFNPFKAVSTIKGLAGPRSATQLSGLGKILSKAGLVNKAGSLTASGMIGIPTMASYFLTDEEKEAQLNKGADLPFPVDYYLSGQYTPNRRLAAEGGRIGAQEGGIMPRLNQLSGSVSSAEQMLQEINQRLQSAESSLGEGGGQLTQLPASGTLASTKDPVTGGGQPFFMGRPLNAALKYENNAGPLMAIPSSGSMTSGIPAASYANGGDVEPVAKKTMPLLDMDGKEMDLRAEGGFVPIGRMEKADDVPARLSKNEFVFTADAVRNAGDGDVDKGAEVMYNMMKNLESGGDVSEESQGLEGARNMFQTSQRLEEVL